MKLPLLLVASVSKSAIVKNLIGVLTLLCSLTVFLFFLSSCKKETTDPAPVVVQPIDWDKAKVYDVIYKKGLSVLSLSDTYLSNDPILSPYSSNTLNTPATLVLNGTDADFIDKAEFYTYKSSASNVTFLISKTTRTGIGPKPIGYSYYVDPTTNNLVFGKGLITSSDGKLENGFTPALDLVFTKKK